MIVERKNSLKINKIGHFKIKNYNFERVENFKYLGIILNEDKSNQMDWRERITNANKTYCVLQKFVKNKNLPRKPKQRLNNTTTDKTLTYGSANWDTNRQR
jgi:hypothetical protein